MDPSPTLSQVPLLPSYYGISCVGWCICYHGYVDTDNIVLSRDVV